MNFSITQYEQAVDNWNEVEVFRLVYNRLPNENDKELIITTMRKYLKLYRMSQLPEYKKNKKKYKDLFDWVEYYILRNK
jgi:hypothetical protein